MPVDREELYEEDETLGEGIGSITKNGANDHTDNKFLDEVESSYKEDLMENRPL